MRRFVISAVLLALTACAGGEVEDTRPGDSAVYRQINAETDCGELQRIFDQAAHFVDTDPDDADAQISYMEAADRRMTDVGCYDD